MSTFNVPLELLCPLGNGWVTKLKTPFNILKHFTFKVVPRELEHTCECRYKNTFQQPDALTHNPKVAGSNPAPATKSITGRLRSNSRPSLFSGDNNLSGLLSKISRLSPADMQLLGSLIQSKPASILTNPSDGIQDWQNELNIRGLSPRTIRLYTTAIRQVFRQYPNPTSQTIRAYLADRLVAVSPTKVRNDQKGLKSFFNFLQEQGLWLDNPVKGMKLLKVAKVIRQAPDKVDVDKLLKA